MSNPTIRIHNLEIDEIIDREMTNEEFKQHQADMKKAVAEEAKAELQALAKQDVLNRLGITADEAKLLLA